MKYAVLAFDDGRKDQYDNAYRILKKYRLVGSIYVTTGFVDGTMNRDDIFLSSREGAMSIPELKECFDYGIEIGSHSDTHTNNTDDINISLKKLFEWGVCKNYRIGFASPSSDICDSNIDTLDSLRSNLKYIRSGTQARRNGIIYAFFYFLNDKLNNNGLFWKLNQASIMSCGEIPRCIPSVTIRSTTRVQNIISFLKRMPDNSAVVLLFHSIKSVEYDGFYDAWCYKTDEFEELCDYLSTTNEIKTVTLDDLIK